MSRSTITPHASHVMREIDGEVCCAVCYAAPWMPIAEQQCGESRADDTEARDAAIAAAYDAGEKLRDMAARLGVSRDTINRVAGERCVRRSVGFKRMPPITLEMVAEATRRQSAGESLEAIAADIGVDFTRLRRKIRDVSKAAQKETA